MGNTKTLLITFLSVIVVGAGVLLALNWDAVSGPQPPRPPCDTCLTTPPEPPPPPTELEGVGADIFSRIQALDDMEWKPDTSRRYFDDVAFAIDNAYKSGTVSEANEEYLSNMLELGYVGLTKRKAKEVLDRSDDINDLHNVHNELKFIADSIGRSDLVSERLRHTSQVYGLRNAIVEMQNAVRSSGVSDLRLEDVYQRIEEYPKREHFQNSRLVKTMSAAGLQELRTAWRQLKRDQLFGPVQEYCGTQEFAPTTTNDFMEDVQDVLGNRRLNGDRLFVKQVENIIALLIRHREAHENFDALTDENGDPTECRKTFAGLQFYIDKCMQSSDSVRKLNNSSN